MRNIIGNPAEGDDFFDRPEILSRLRRDLDEGANILLVAPRRVGKTSLALELCKQWRAESRRKAVFLNVEGRTDELAFAEKLVDELGRAGLNPELFTRAAGILTKVRQAIVGKGMKVPGLDLEVGEADDPDHATVSKAIESAFRKIEQGDTTVLIAIDELPEFLLTLQREDDGPKRVVTFLHWLRELRQTFRHRIRWLFLGSIGLDTFVEAQKLQKLINDLLVFPLEAFSRPEADAFLIELGQSNNVPLDEGERDEILERIGWPLAYHLQLVFHELRDLPTRSIADAFASLLQPHKLSYFDTWHERLDTQFTAADAKACKDILGHLCHHPSGREHGQVLDALMTNPAADADKIGPQLRTLLLVLQRDGYLLEGGGRYAFRSFLLREYWRRRHAK